jgi:Na+-transporting methylmalonyl-CoA/oxaloacetate decarboxylase gamma subunit
MFDNSVGSVMILSLIDMSVVFLVLTFLMVVVYVTAFGVKHSRRAAVETPGGPSPAPEAVPQTAPDTVPDAAEDEYELVAVQAAALAAHEAAGRGTVESPELPTSSPEAQVQASSPWKHWSLQRGTRPRWK